MGKAEEIGGKHLELFKSITPEPPLANESGILKRLKQDWVVLGLRYFPYQFMQVMADIAGEEAAADCLYRFGVGCGKEIYTRYIKLGKDKETAMDLTCAGATYFGWGPVEVLDREKGLARLYNSYEARSYLANKEKAERPVCYFFGGVIVGVFSLYWDEECMVKETKCFAMGDEYCEFEVTPKGY